MPRLFGNRKKSNEATSTLSTRTVSSGTQHSLPLSQDSDYSYVSDEKIYNPGGQPLSSPPSAKPVGRVHVKQVDDYPSPPQSTVNVYVNSPSPRAATRTTYSSYTPQRTSQQPTPSHCGVPCIRKITRRSNRNNNAGRPYYICADCDKFVSWDDEIGQNDDNPVCDCGRPSRLQITGVDKGRKFFYKCVAGKCDFYEWKLKDDGTHVAVKEDVADALRDLGIA